VKDRQKKSGKSSPSGPVLSVVKPSPDDKRLPPSGLRRAATEPDADEQFLTIIDQASDGVVMVENGLHLYANRRLVEIFGYDRQDEIVGTPLTSLIHPEDVDMIAGYLDRRRHRKQLSGARPGMVKPRVYEFRGIAKTGKTIYLEGSDTGIAFRGRSVTLCFVRDVTLRKESEEEALRKNSELSEQVREGGVRLDRAYKLLEQEVAERKSAEAALRASEARYRAIVDDQAELVCRFLPDTTITFANDAFCRFFDATPESLMGQSFVPLMTDRGEGRQKAIAGDALIPKTPAWSGETPVMRADGQKRWLQWAGRAILDGDGVPIEFQGVGRDITEARLAEEQRRATEAALRESEEKFRVLAENTAAGIVIYRNNRILYTNPAMSTMTGFSPEEFAGMTVLDTVHPGVREEARQWSRNIAKGQWVTTKVETKPLTKDGVDCWADATVGRVVIDDQPALMATLIDVTARKTGENALRQKAEDIEKLYDTSRDLLQHVEMGRIYGEICRVGVERFSFRMVWVGLFDRRDGSVVPVAFFGSDPEDSFLVEEDGHATWCVTQHVAGGPIGRAVRSSQPSVSNDIEKDHFFSPWRKVSLEKGCRSAAAFPLINDEEVFGVIVGYSSSPGHFTDERVHLYQSFANLAANAIANTRLLNSLSRQRDEIRKMTSRLADVEETERRQLARELHDRVGQNLTALSINLNILRNMSSGDAQADSRLDDCLGLLNNMTDSIRNVMGQLRPTLLDEYGLVAALREYCSGFSRRFGLDVDVQGDGSSTGLLPVSETALFRIAQEALNNIAKHAHARRVTISVSRLKNGVRMAIADDGVGFSVGKSENGGCRKGWGLRTMAERADAIGGTCHIESDERGTLVSVEVTHT
jgi:PAS domain S-box-containing protein